MMRLKYLGRATLTSLFAEIGSHIERYTGGDFRDLEAEGDWNITLSIEYDPEPLSRLDESKTEVDNSLLVWNALQNLTPALACEDRIWTRLSHIDCLDYSRKRWLNEESGENDVRRHFFAPTHTGCRDDHSIARLWWNAKIAKDIWPHNQKGALELLLMKSDIRSNLVERPWTIMRHELADAILRLMQQEPWVTEKEKHFREFMKAVNRTGGGAVFELWPKEKIDSFVHDCFESAVASPEIEPT